MTNKAYPIRMCIVCRKKFLQSNLHRFIIKDKIILKYDKIGRSFYICHDCLENNTFLNKIIKKKYKSLKEQDITKNLKEIVANE